MFQSLNFINQIFNWLLKIKELSVCIRRHRQVRLALKLSRISECKGNGKLSIMNTTYLRLLLELSRFIFFGWMLYHYLDFLFLKLDASPLRFVPFPFSNFYSAIV